ncbi:MAG: hypothetical protein ACLP1D_23910 [Xanthobacteraceae bacterium]
MVQIATSDSRPWNDTRHDRHSTNDFAEWMIMNLLHQCDASLGRYPENRARVELPSLRSSALRARSISALPR